jgi:hypothetical protein
MIRKNKITKHNRRSINYNQQVKQAYLQILRKTRLLLASIEEEPLRYTLIKKPTHYLEQEAVEQELINSLLYLQLGIYGDKRRIYYGFELSSPYGHCHSVTDAFLRLIYEATSRSNTLINIKDCVHTDNLITECTTMYEYTEHHDRGYRFRQVNYKPKTVKRKLQRVA